ncbi:MAG: hypothetical protein HYU59_09065 [Magnetospirillum gryphiswaldense]|uniref:Uncharacterized protein n=1 Tax=Magnetospirillum sulfuroxidans TaxID=611300 RepID=A0ABS5IGW5_9PROT|nr:hypothetical protein [Magnetospirillum sulfuroxidans]MBI2240936.1 hypothetical protein [Magnetospirillum gryphiswaldense]MBR9973579.1 hypothetical protein [Magnetospirillum sulfuroxidans]
MKTLLGYASITLAVLGLAAYAFRPAARTMPWYKFAGAVIVMLGMGIGLIVIDAKKETEISVPRNPEMNAGRQVRSAGKDENREEYLQKFINDAMTTNRVIDQGRDLLLKYAAKGNDADLTSAVLETAKLVELVDVKIIQLDAFGAKIFYKEQHLNQLKLVISGLEQRLKALEIMGKSFDGLRTGNLPEDRVNIAIQTANSEFKRLGSAFFEDLAKLKSMYINQ